MEVPPTVFLDGVLGGAGGAQRQQPLIPLPLQVGTPKAANMLRGENSAAIANREIAAMYVSSISVPSALPYPIVYR